MYIVLSSSFPKTIFWKIKAELKRLDWISLLVNEKSTLFLKTFFLIT